MCLCDRIGGGCVRHGWREKRKGYCWYYDCMMIEVGRREGKERIEGELREEVFLLRRIKGVVGFLYRLEGLCCTFSNWERGASWFGIERDMETTLDLLYTEKGPNTTQFFCFGVRVCIFMQLRCQNTPYPVILYVQWCKRKIIGCLASIVMLCYVIPSLSHTQCLPNPQGNHPKQSISSNNIYFTSYPTSKWLI